MLIFRANTARLPLLSTCTAANETTGGLHRTYTAMAGPNRYGLKILTNQDALMRRRFHGSLPERDCQQSLLAARMNHLEPRSVSPPRSHTAGLCCQSSRVIFVAQIGPNSDLPHGITILSIDESSHTDYSQGTACSLISPIRLQDGLGAERPRCASGTCHDGGCSTVLKSRVLVCSFVTRSRSSDIFDVGSGDLVLVQTGGTYVGS